MGLFSSKSQKQTTQVKPYAPIAGQVEQNAGNLGTFYNNQVNWPKYYPDSTVAPETPLQNASTQWANHFATSQFPKFQANQNQGMDWFANEGMQVNPYLQDHINTAVQPLWQDLHERALPQINAGAMGTGNVGSSRHGIAQGRAIDATQREVGNVATRMASDAYDQGVRNYLESYLNIPQAIRGTGEGINQMYTSGTRNQTQDQMTLDEAKKRWDYNENINREMIMEYINALNATGGNYTTTKTKTSGGGSSPLSSIAGLAMTAAGTMLGGPVGGAVGGAIGSSLSGGGAAAPVGPTIQPNMAPVTSLAPYRINQ